MHNPQAPPTADGWTEQETLLLLEGLELYGDKWDDVAEHVGSRSQLACILHFLSLPIEEQFVDEAVAGREGVAGPLPEGDEAAEEEEAFVPFADAGNPIMAQVRCLFFVLFLVVLFALFVVLCGEAVCGFWSCNDTYAAVCLPSTSVRHAACVFDNNGGAACGGCGCKEGAGVPWRDGGRGW